MKSAWLSIWFVCTFVVVSLGQDVPNLYKTELFAYGGIPAADSDVKVLVNTAYVAGYSEAMKNPLWVAYRFGNRASGKVVKFERPYFFKVDLRTDARIAHEDYASSGYDRGHMAPNASFMEQYGQMAQMETYFMSNIIPQSPQLNRGIWAKLEAKVRGELSQDDTKNKEVHDLYVITGPIFEKNPPDTMASGVPIPTHCYKILAYQRGYFGTIKAVAFIFPQQPESDEFLDYAVSVDEIEEKTGIDFFSLLSKQKQKNLESVKRNFALETIP